MKIKIKRLTKSACIPSYQKEGDAGMDLTAISRHFDENGNAVYGTGLCFEIPKGYVGLLFPRSSNAKKDLILSNSVGVVDSGYRGEVMFKFKPVSYFADDLPPDGLTGRTTDSFDYVCPGKYSKEDIDDDTQLYEIGDRIGQIIVIPIPEVEFEEVNELSETERGSGGYGSTGVK